MERKQTMARGGAAAWTLIFACSLSLFSQAGRREVALIGDSGEQERIVVEARSATAEPREIEAQILFDPVSRSIMGMARLRFDAAAGAKTFALDDELAVDAILTGSAAARFFRRDHRVYLAGSGLQEALVCFAGRLPPWGMQEKQLAAQPGASLAAGDDFLTLQTDCLAFMPSSCLRFARCRVTVHVPARFNCLGSGIRRELPARSGLNAFSFDSIASRGFMLICGDFQRRDRLDGELPVNFYASPRLDMNSCRDAKKMRGVVDFFCGRFGRLDVPELNILLCRASFQGGVSQLGCIVCFFNPADAGKKLAALERLCRESPVFLHDPRCDCLVHEIAHQWWGGLCSWSSRADSWITEGLAQFSTLLYLHGRLPAAEFDPILERMGKWVERYEGAGKVTENLRLNLVRRDPLCAQAIVYNRSTLILWMLRELLGEEEICARLRRLLAERRGAGWSSPAFCAWMAGNDPLLEAFFDSWVNRADLPAVRCRLRGEGRVMRVTIEQVSGPFVFPLRLVAPSTAGAQVHQLVVSRGQEEFSIAFADAVPGKVVASSWVPMRIEMVE